MRVVKVSMGGCSYIAPLDEALLEVRCLFEEDEDIDGPIVTMEGMEMSEGELDDLPEFDGW